jgi:hypothetical protein
MFHDAYHLEEVINSGEQVLWYPLNPYGEGYVRISQIRGKWSKEQLQNFFEYLEKGQIY